MFTNEPPLGSGRWRVGADIGGTFTDVIALDDRAQVVATKVLSTPSEFHRGVIDGVVAALAQGDVDPVSTSAVLHATTVATNAILERDGAATGVVTTRGFRDVLELGRLRRPSLYDLSWKKPEPLAKRRHRYGLAHRIGARGEVIESVSPGDVRVIADAARRDNVSAIAVCLLNAYLRPDVERDVADQLRDLLPGVYITASVDISPQMHEFERTSTATVNAYVGPVVRNYIGALRAGLDELNVHAPLRIMQSTGGLIGDAEVVERPVQIIESGPAAGVVGVQKLAQHMGLDNVVAFDMGGTTAKASLIEDGKPFVAADYEVGGGMNVARGLGKGAGYAVRVPSIDIAEVGAGGGSIVSVDVAGAMHVGPQSASAWPGPAAYGKGGELPTLTDANVMLGYLSSTAIAGGRVRIHPDLARRAMESVAVDGAMDAMSLARGAYDIAVANMSNAVKAVTSERGRDPRDSVMVAFGGAGPLYGAALAKELGIGTVLIPVHTGVFSSLGLLVADSQAEGVAPVVEATTSNAMAHGFDRLVADVVDQLPEGEGDIVVERLLDMRYRGQRFELRIAVPAGSFDDESFAIARKQFHESHRRTYGRSGDDGLVEVVNLRARAIRPNPTSLPDVLRIGDTAAAESTRECWFGGPVDTPVLTRSALTTTPRPGPLVIEEQDSTTLVPPDATAYRDALNNIVISGTSEEHNS